jgi:hypothetical protein
MEKFYIPKVYLFNLKPEDKMYLYWALKYKNRSDTLTAIGFLKCPICRHQQHRDLSAGPHPYVPHDGILFSDINNDPRGSVIVKREDWYKEALRQAEVMFRVCMDNPDLHSHNVFIMKKKINSDLYEVGSLLHMGTSRRSTKKFNSAFDRIIKLKAFL